MRQAKCLSKTIKSAPCDGCCNASICRDAGLACFRFARFAGGAGPEVSPYRKSPDRPCRAIHNHLFGDHIEEENEPAREREECVKQLPLAIGSYVPDKEGGGRLPGTSQDPKGR